MNLDYSEIYILDKKGKTININTELATSETKFFIFNKIFYKDKLLKIFEDNIEKLLNYINFSNYVPTSLTNLNLSNLINYSFLNETNTEQFDRLGTPLSEIKKVYELLVDNIDQGKEKYKNLKIQIKLCDKTKENYNLQFNSLESIYTNISGLYE